MGREGRRSTLLAKQRLDKRIRRLIASSGLNIGFHFHVLPSLVLEPLSLRGNGPDLMCEKGAREPPLGHHSQALNASLTNPKLGKDHASCYLDELNPLVSTLSAAADGTI